MPFYLSFFLTLSAVMWFVYDVFLKDICIVIPNVLGFALGLLQMLLYAIYNDGAKEKVVITEEHALEQMENVVVMSPSGTCEVYMIPIINDVDDKGKEGEEEKEKSGEDKDCHA
ncbi:bidirectional sugar transporter SWEET15-like [Lotus japonicus]|uniref:bidirectional sugar transporter SWEET15-like n=1 Tax=Lotus japonicus TaxID=34305 RepID=UPI0025887B2A|nr:bidirectional sugar transporter SWEET15-like [Lotus japonicus]